MTKMMNMVGVMLYDNLPTHNLADRGNGSLLVGDKEAVK